MIYPQFLRPGDTIGVTAPSSGIKNKERFLLALSHFEKAGYKVLLTDNVFRREGIASTDRETRIREFESLLRNPEVKMIWAATGGDMMIEMLERMDYETIRGNVKWIMGYSDITHLVSPITLKCDIATLYGPNIGGFDMTNLHPMLQNALDLISGRLVVQHSSDLHERTRVKGADGYHLDTPTAWITEGGELHVRGRMLSVCIDCISHEIGTPFAPVPDFIERYREDGVIWNFDNYALSSEALYYTLWQMKHAGWFENTRAVILSRTLYPSSEFDYPYFDAAKNALGDIPFVLEADTGHVKPQMTLINGALATLHLRDGKASVLHELL